MKTLYMIKDLQEILGISRPADRALLDRHEFPWKRVNGKYLIPSITFDTWLTQSHEYTDPRKDAAQP